MTFKEISDRLHDLSLYETRSFTHSYVEVVLFNKDAIVWETSLQEIFGSPAKEAAKKPSKEIKALAKDHGGISVGQTLFKKDSEAGLILAMLWPWQDRTHTTLKMFVLEEDSGSQKANSRTSKRGWVGWFLNIPCRLMGGTKRNDKTCLLLIYAKADTTL